MRQAIIENGKVVNVVVADENWRPITGIAIPCGPEISPGATWDGQRFHDHRYKPKQVTPLPAALLRGYSRIEEAYGIENARLHLTVDDREAMRRGALTYIAHMRAAGTTEAAYAIVKEAIAFLRNFSPQPFIPNNHEIPDQPPQEPAPELVAAIERALPQTAPPPLPEPSRPVQEPYSFQDVLSAADDDSGPIVIPPLPPPEMVIPEPLPPLPVADESEPTRRAAARGLIAQAMADAGKTDPHEQRMYELALMAKNGNTEALRDLAPVAAARAMQMPDLVSAIIDQYHARLRRSAYLETLKARALGELDAAKGEDIDRVAESYAREIRNGNDG